MRMRFGRFFSSALVAAAVVTLAGCAFVRGDYNGGIEPDRVAFIQKGVTTRSEVISRLGAPDEVKFADMKVVVRAGATDQNDVGAGREIDHYRHYTGRVGSFIPVLVVFSRVSVQSDDLYVFYNPDGVVDEVIYGNRTNGMSFRWWPFGE